MIQGRLLFCLRLQSAMSFLVSNSTHTHTHTRELNGAERERKYACDRDDAEKETGL